MRGWIRQAARLIVHTVADLKVTGMEHFPKTGACIAASNHLGRLEATLPLVVTDRDDLILFIAEKYRKSALWRFAARQVDGIFINRFDVDFAALREGYKRLKQGGYLAIAPEGTRSQTGSLSEGKPGAAYLAAKTGAPVVPVAIYGTADQNVVENLKRLRRSKIVVQAGRPFTIPSLPRKGRDEFLQRQTDEIMCRIAAMLPSRYRGIYAGHPRLQELLAESDQAPAVEK